MEGARLQLKCVVGGRGREEGGREELHGLDSICWEVCYILKVINFASFVNTDIYVEIYAMILLY